MKDTEELILNTTFRLLEEYSLDKLNVRLICDECGINRNTFYYHYEDIYAVLEALLSCKLEEFQASCSPSSLLEDYDKRVAFIQKHKKIIMHMYHSKERDALKLYLHSLTHSFVSEYVSKAAGGRPLKEEDMAFICNFYECALEGLIYRWIENDMPEYDEDLHKRFTQAFMITVRPLVGLR